MAFLEHLKDKRRFSASFLSAAIVRIQVYRLLGCTFQHRGEETVRAVPVRIEPQKGPLRERRLAQERAD
jgi:hypothetical protein